MVGFITIFALVPFLAIKLERHCTFADREMAILFKLTAFQILNTVLPSMIFASRSGDHLFSEFGAPNGTFVAELGLPRAWYGSGGAIVISALVGDMVVINFGIDFLRPDVIIARRLAKRSRTQRQMNGGYKRDADIYIAFRLQLLVKAIFITLMYGPGLPGCYLISFLFFVSAHWIDRHNLLRVFAPPPPTTDRMMKSIVRIFLPLAVLMHLVMAAVFFSELEPLPNGATLIVTVNVAVFAPPVLYFILREQLGRKGRAVQVLPQHRFKTFREWFLDIKDDSGPIRAGDSNPETFRETNDLALYVPPLTRTLLNSLGAGTSFAAVNASRRRAESEQGSPLKGRTKREFGAGAPATEGGDRHRKSVSFPLRPGDDDGGDDEESPAAPPKRLSPTRSRTAGGGPLIGRNRQSAQPALQRAHSSRERGVSGPATAPRLGAQGPVGTPDSLRPNSATSSHDDLSDTLESSMGVRVERSMHPTSRLGAGLGGGAGLRIEVGRAALGSGPLSASCDGDSTVTTPDVVVPGPRTSSCTGGGAGGAAPLVAPGARRAPPATVAGGPRHVGHARSIEVLRADSNEMHQGIRGSLETDAPAPEFHRSQSAGAQRSRPQTPMSPDSD